MLTRQNILAVVLSLGTLASGYATVVTTNVDEDDGNLLSTNGSGTSLREALNHSPAGTTITFDPTLSGQTITLTNGQLLITRAVTIDASSLDQKVIIDANGIITNHRVIEITAIAGDITLRNLTITGGRTANSAFGNSEPGGGIFHRNRINSGALTLEHCKVTNNATGTGEEGTNGSGGDGGGICSESTLEIKNCTFTENSTGNGYFGGRGGAIYTTGSLFLNDTTVSNNYTGDGLFAGGGGGGINGESEIILNRCLVANNVTGNSGSGGGIFCRGGSLTLDSTTVTANTTGNGEIFGGRGGGIYIDNLNNLNGSAILKNSKILSNSTGEITDQEFNSSDGGGIYADHELLIINCTVAYNRTSDGSDGGSNGGSGGGIYARKSLTVHNSTIAHNFTGKGNSGSPFFTIPSSGGNGGGIYLDGSTSDSLNLNNSTIVYNYTGDGGDSGFFGPVAGSGGGVYSDSPTYVDNSIISQNTTGVTAFTGNSGTGPDTFLGSNIISTGVNFIGNTSGISLSPLPSNILSGNALLAPLDNYGNSTLTVLPLPGSPVIDPPGGDISSIFTTDQRGITRVVNGTLDIGAVEYDPTLDEPIFTPVITSFIKATGFDPVTNPVFELTFTTFPGLSYSVRNNATLQGSSSPLISYSVRNNATLQGSSSPLTPTIEADNITMSLEVTLDPTKDFIHVIRE